MTRFHQVARRWRSSFQANRFGDILCGCQNSNSRSALRTLALVGCTSGLDTWFHFDPPSSTTLSSVNSLVHVINLDAEPTICYSTDGSPVEWSDGSLCQEARRQPTIAVPACGFNLIHIAWPTGSGTKPTTRWKAKPVRPAASRWFHGQTAMSWRKRLRAGPTRSMHAQQLPKPVEHRQLVDELRLGKVSWNVSLNGLRARSARSPTSPMRTRSASTRQRQRQDGLSQVQLGHFGQAGSGTPTSTAAATKAATSRSRVTSGQINSRMVLDSKQRTGGTVDAGCTVDQSTASSVPSGSDDCVQLSRLELSRRRSVGRCVENLQTPDSDGDGVTDDKDNCPMVANTDQLDVDRDGVGDEVRQRAGICAASLQVGGAAV